MRPFLSIFRCLYLTTSMAPVIAGQDVELHADSSPLDKMLPGIVTAVDVATLSVPMNGILDRIYVTEGDRISRKQPLASLDDKIALASVRLAEVMADQQSIILLARQQQEQAERFLRRVSTAHTSMAASDFELDQAQGEFNSACQLLKQAEERQRQALAQLELERAKLASHQITAPFDGRVSRISAHVGESMNSSQPLLQIVNLSQLKVELYIPASLFGDLVVGNEYSLNAGIPVSGQVRATLKTSENSIDAATNTFRCVFLIDNPDEKLPAGFWARLALKSTAVTAQTVPRIR